VTAATEAGVYIAALSPTDIFADSTYQRVCDVAHARRMAAGWDRRLAGIIEVSDRGPDASPRYAVIDGQHRWAAARFLADPPQLVAHVHEGLSVTGEAELFAKLNRQRKQITTWDHWKARRAAGDPLVSAIEASITRVGLKVTESGVTPGGISCVSTVEKIASSAGGINLLDNTLTVLTAAWPNQRVMYEAPLVMGTALVLAAFGERIDHQHLINALAEGQAKRIRIAAVTLRDSGMMSGSLGKLAAHAILTEYNRHRRTGPAHRTGYYNLGWSPAWKGTLPKPAAQQQTPAVTSENRAPAENMPENIPAADTTTHPNSIDALDEAITNTRNKIAELDQALTGTGPAARPPHPSDEYGDTW